VRWEEIARFFQETQAVSALNHPGQGIPWDRGYLHAGDLLIHPSGADNPSLSGNIPDAGISIIRWIYLLSPPQLRKYAIFQTNSPLMMYLEEKTVYY
jgi:hypothetical protein